MLELKTYLTVPTYHVISHHIMLAYMIPSKYEHNICNKKK